MIMLIKYTLFLLVLFVAAIIDANKKIVPNTVQCLLLALGLINCSLENFLCGAFIFFTFFIPTLIKGGLGGGDIKLAALCGFVVGIPAIPALVLGLLITIFYMLIRKKLQKKGEVALVPFIFSGFFFVFALNFIFLKGSLLL